MFFHWMIMKIGQQYIWLSALHFVASFRSRDLKNTHFWSEFNARKWHHEFNLKHRSHTLARTHCSSCPHTWYLMILWISKLSAVHHLFTVIGSFCGPPLRLRKRFTVRTGLTALDEVLGTRSPQWAALDIFVEHVVRPFKNSMIHATYTVRTVLPTKPLTKLLPHVTRGYSASPPANCTAPRSQLAGSSDWRLSNALKTSCGEERAHSNDSRQFVKQRERIQIGPYAS